MIFRGKRWKLSRNWLIDPYVCLCLSKRCSAGVISADLDATESSALRGEDGGDTAEHA